MSKWKRTSLVMFLLVLVLLLSGCTLGTNTSDQPVATGEPATGGEQAGPQNWYRVSDAGFEQLDGVYRFTRDYALVEDSFVLVVRLYTEPPRLDHEPEPEYYDLARIEIWNRSDERLWLNPGNTSFTESSSEKPPEERLSCMEFIDWFEGNYPRWLEPGESARYTVDLMGQPLGFVWVTGSDVEPGWEDWRDFDHVSVHFDEATEIDRADLAGRLSELDADTDSQSYAETTILADVAAPDEVRKVLVEAQSRLRAVDVIRWETGITRTPAMRRCLSNQLEEHDYVKVGGEGYVLYRERDSGPIVVCDYTFNNCQELWPPVDRGEVRSVDGSQVTFWTRNMEHRAMPFLVDFPAEVRYDLERGIHDELVPTFVKLTEPVDVGHFGDPVTGSGEGEEFNAITRVYLDGIAFAMELVDVREVMAGGFDQMPQCLHTSYLPASSEFRVVMHHVRLTPEASQELENLDFSSHPYINSVRLEEDREAHSATLYFKLDGATYFTVYTHRTGQRDGRFAGIESLLFSPEPTMQVGQSIIFGDQVGAVGPPDNELTGVEVGADRVVFSLDDIREHSLPRLTWTSTRYLAADDVLEVTFHRAKLSEEGAPVVKGDGSKERAVTDVEVIEDTEDRSVKIRLSLNDAQYYRFWVRTSREPGEMELVTEFGVPVEE